MNEFLAYEGRLVQLDLEAARLRVRLEGLRESIALGVARVRPVEEMNGQVLADQAMQFCTTLEELNAALAEVAEIKKIMGRR